MTSPQLSALAARCNARGASPSRGGAAAAWLVAIAGYEERPTPDGATWINPFLATFGASDPLAPRWTTTRRIPPAERCTAVDVAPHVIATGGNLADGPVPGTFLTVRDDDAFILWQRHLSMIATDTIAAVRVLPNGDVLWAGTTSATLGETNHGGADIVVGRIEGTSGFTRWTAQLGTAREEHVSDLAIDDAGHIYLATRIDISVTRSGFEPGNIAVQANKPVTLVFTRKTDATCAKRVVLTLDDGKQLARDLPLEKPVELTVTFPRAGKLAYACSMGMVNGIVVVQ